MKKDLFKVVSTIDGDPFRTMAYRHKGGKINPTSIEFASKEILDDAYNTVGSVIDNWVKTEASRSFRKGLLVGTFV